MAEDFPIGTRLTIRGKTFEVTADSDRPTCAACALSPSNAIVTMLGEDGKLEYNHSLNSRICMCLECLPKFREDGKSVHWELINE